MPACVLTDPSRLERIPEATHGEQEHTQANEVLEGIPSGMGPRHKSMVYLNPNEVVFMKNQLESDHKMSDSNLKFATEVERPSFSKANFRPTRKPKFTSVLECIQR